MIFCGAFNEKRVLVIWEEENDGKAAQNNLILINNWRVI